MASFYAEYGIAALVKINCILLYGYGRRGLYCRAEYYRHSGAYPSEYAAVAVGTCSDLIAVVVEFIVVFASPELCRSEALAEFYAFYGGYAENDRRDDILYAVEHRTACAGRDAGHGTFYGAADAVAFKSALLDKLAHLCFSALIYKTENS